MYIDLIGFDPEREHKNASRSQKQIFALVGDQSDAMSVAILLNQLGHPVQRAENFHDGRIALFVENPIYEQKNDLEAVGRYHINYHTGAGDEWVEGTLTEAQKIADESAAYTQQPITIENESGEEVARRPWWGVEYDQTEGAENDIIGFGKLGHYGAWE